MVQAPGYVQCIGNTVLFDSMKGLMIGWRNELMDGRMIGLKDGWIDKWIEGWKWKDWWMEGWMDWWMDLLMERRMNALDDRTDRQPEPSKGDEWMAKLKDRLACKQRSEWWTDGQTNRLYSPSRNEARQPSWRSFFTNKLITDAGLAWSSVEHSSYRTMVAVFEYLENRSLASLFCITEQMLRFPRLSRFSMSEGRVILIAPRTWERVNSLCERQSMICKLLLFLLISSRSLSGQQ